MLRERGIILVGPDPHSMIEPVFPDHLRQAMIFHLTGWGMLILAAPQQLRGRGYQSYVVLSLCRILYTLEHGEVVSKRTATNWAAKSLGESWANLIESAWFGRHHPNQPASPEDITRTLDFIRYTLQFAGIKP